jgi:DNA-binding transcriptional ArsR family regulator
LVASEVKQLAESQAEIYRIFSHSNRVQIFWLLMEAEMSVNDIAESIEASIQNTSQHLRLMKAATILDTRREGQTIYYRIADSDIGNYCRRILEMNLAEFRMSVM